MARKSGSSNTGYSIERRDRATGKPHWRVRIWVPDEESIDDGKKKSHIVGTYATKTLAQEAGQNAVRERQQGTLVRRNDMTLNDLLAEWLEQHEANVTPNTIRDYESAMKGHVNKAFGKNDLKSLSPAKFNALYKAWQKDGMSARMVRRCHVVLSQALSYGVLNGYLVRNPTMGVKPPKLEVAKPTVWSPDEVGRFLHAAMNYPTFHRAASTSKAKSIAVPGSERPDELTPLWHFLVLEGMRRGEALGLRWKDVSWDRGTVHISQSVIADKSNNGRPQIQSRTKTGTGARTVRLTPQTIEVLRAHRTRQNAIRLAAKEWEDNDLIVCTSVGTPITPSNVRRSFVRLMDYAGLPHIRVHDLRHTSATLLLRAGVPTKIVSERLGHKSVGITFDLYSHVTPDMQEIAADAMAKIVTLNSTAN